MAAATLIGLVGGLGAVGFAFLIDGLHWFFVDFVVTDGLSALPSWRILLAPALGAILVGPITRIFAPEARGHGVPEVMLAVETGGGRIRPRVAIAKSVASAQQRAEELKQVAAAAQEQAKPTPAEQQAISAASASPLSYPASTLEPGFRGNA